MTTVIATKKAIYADTLCTYSTIFKVSKLVRIGRSVYGFAGDLEEALHFLEWRRSGKDKPEFADDASLDVIEINKAGLFIWSKRLIAMKMNQRVYAIGSGAQYATGAMAMGMALLIGLTLGTVAGYFGDERLRVSRGRLWLRRPGKATTRRHPGRIHASAACFAITRMPAPTMSLTKSGMWAIVCRVLGHLLGRLSHLQPSIVAAATPEAPARGRAPHPGW